MCLVFGVLNQGFPSKVLGPSPPTACLRNPHHLVAEEQGRRRLHPQEFVRRMSCRQRQVPGGRGEHDEGTNGVSSIGDEDQGGCSTRQHHPHCRRQTLRGVEVLSSPKINKLLDGNIFTVDAEGSCAEVLFYNHFRCAAILLPSFKRQKVGWR